MLKDNREKEKKSPMPGFLGYVFSLLSIVLKNHLLDLKILQM